MYVDCRLDREQNLIHVVERDNSGQRKFTSYPTKYVAYWPSETGKYTSIFGDRLDKFQTTKLKEFQKEIRTLNAKRLFETDINPIFRCLYDNYRHLPAPKLNLATLDIETDFSPERGWSSVEEAFAPITAISVYCDWIDKNLTLVLKPKQMDQATAIAIVNNFPDTLLCDSEKELLDIFLQIIEDADVITGWNSEQYDIPYIHNRIVQILGKQETRRLCLWNQLPSKRNFISAFGKECTTYDLVGRVHLDYLQLYRKHAEQVLHSYRLDFVGEHEVGEHKIHYQGSLDTLYNQDFEKFIEYNRQDVMLLVKIDRKKKFIELANQMAHENGVLLQTTMGAVAQIDQAIVNSAWNQNLQIPARIRDKPIELDDLLANSRDSADWDPEAEEEPVFDRIAGAYVADPKRGMHEWIGSMDISSLYPSTIRALNLSPETIVGQIRLDATNQLLMSRVKNEKMSFSEAWTDLFAVLEYTAVMNQDITPITVDFTDGSTICVPARDIYDLVFGKNSKLILTANGTIVDGSKQGIIPAILSQWYSERKILQAKMRAINELSAGIDIPQELQDQLC